MASIEGKCLVLVNVNLRRFQKCVSIHYHITNARAIVGKASLRGSGNMEIEDSYTGMISTPVRSVSVIYISTRLIISATWMRQIPNLIQKEGSIGNKTNGMVMKKRHSEDGSIHEGLFQFDKAFAQEIKYLFAELDFDLYMCREKQDAMKQQYAKYQKDLTWKFKEQNETLVYFVRGNEAVRVSNEMGMNEAKQIPMDYSDNNRSKHQIDVAVEDYLEQCLNERTVDVTIEDYLRQCIKERRTDVTVEDYFDKCLNKLATDVTVEAYLQKCLNERAKDVTVEDYLNQYRHERIEDVTVEAYLQQCLNERAKDVTVEDYLNQCLNERAKDVTVEDYLDQCLNERESEILTEAEEDVWSMFRYDLAEGSSRLLSYDTADDEKLSKNRNNTDYLMTDANNNVNKEAGEGIRTQGSRLKNLCAEEMQLDLAENQPETKNESTRKASPLIVEENLFEQYQSVDESIYEVDFSGYHDDLTGSKYSIVEEDIAACSFAEKEMLSMEEALERQGMIYSAELWLIFVPYRRSPWTQVSVSYYDNFTFDWSISKIEEASALETAAESVGNGNDENNTFLSGGFCTRVEEDVIAQNQVAVVLEEIQFSSLDDVGCSKRNDVTEKENNVTALGESKPDGVSGLGDPRNTKYDIAIVKIDHNHTEKKREATGKEFSSLSSLSKKGFMYKSREKVFVGHEAESSSGWNSLEKIQYKQTKLISVPETLRRTVSSELIKVNTSGADKDVEEKETSSKEVYSGSLLISPFQGFGKNLKESNV